MTAQQFLDSLTAAYSVLEIRNRSGVVLWTRSYWRADGHVWALSAVPNVLNYSKPAVLDDPLADIEETMAWIERIKEQ